MSNKFGRFYSNFVAFSEYMNIIVFLHVSKLWCQVPVCELFLIALKFEDMTSTCKKHSTHTFTAEIMRPDCVLNLLSNRRAKFKSNVFDMTVGKNQPRFEMSKTKKAVVI